MELVIALIGLVGTVMAGGAVTELIKRRNLRANILADLEIWSKLPDGTVKTRLYDNITSQVVMTTISSKWPSLVFTFFWWTGSMNLILITYNAKFERNDQGVLRLVGSDLDLPLYYACLIYAGGLILSIVFTVICSEVSDNVTDRLENRRIKKGIKELGADYASNPTHVAAAQKILNEGHADTNVMTMANAIVEAAEKATPSPESDEPINVEPFDVDPEPSATTEDPRPTS